MGELTKVKEELSVELAQGNIAPSSLLTDWDVTLSLAGGHSVLADPEVVRIRLVRPIIHHKVQSGIQRPETDAQTHRRGGRSTAIQRNGERERGGETSEQMVCDKSVPEPIPAGSLLNIPRHAGLSSITSKLAQKEDRREDMFPSFPFPTIWRSPGGVINETLETGG